MSESDTLKGEINDITLLENKLKSLKVDLRQKKEIILAQHSKLEVFFDTSIDAVVQMDFDGYITGWNHQAEKMFGWSAQEILDQTIEQTIIPERYRAAHHHGMQRYLASGESSVLNTLIEIHALHRDGHEFPVELSISVIDSPDVQEFNAYIRDISDRKKAESTIWNQANFDSLTKLPNRNLFLQRLEHEALSCDRSNRSLALLHIDLDRFKEINDSMGHKMGDSLLTEASRRLRRSVREVDTVSRLSGDEFTIILGEIDDQLSVQRVCEHLLGSLSEAFNLNDEMVNLTASIGISFYPDDTGDTEILQRNANQAMYAAKTQGRNRYQFFTSELQERALHKRQMITDLHNALERSEFEIYYQPILDLNDSSLTRAEAVLRWHHPESGMVKPDIFRPIAEEIGLIGHIGNWLFYQATRKVKYWREQFSSEFQISFDTSVLQWIDDNAEMNKWFAHLNEQGIEGSAINLEISEALLMNPDDRITNRLIDLRDADIQVSIDNFGTGCSSLSHLKQFDINFLKIDHSFVRDLDRDANNLALCEAMIAMAHKLGIKVIAEGVENLAQHELLKGFGCDYGQGPHYSRLLSVTEFETRLADRE